MACILGLFSSINAQLEVQIGEGSATNANLPTNLYYEHSVSQQIYTAEDMQGAVGSITGFSVKLASPAVNVNRDFAIYMVNTDKLSFESNYDWYPVTQNDLVYDGIVTLNGYDGDLVTIDFQTPFEYTGENLILYICDKTGGFASTTRFYTWTSAASRSLRVARDVTPYDVNNMSSISGSRLSMNNQITFYVLPQGGSASIIDVTPKPIELGARPNGYWMRPVTVEIATKGLPISIAAIETTESYFSFPSMEMPYEMGGQETLSFDITHAEGNGDMSGILAIAFSETRNVELIDMTAFAYDPVTPDVWELAQEVTEYPFEDSPVNIYDNYLLPGEATDGLDAVYALTFDRDILLTATVDGDDPKVALYAEDFNGGFGPAQDNNFVHEGSLDTEMVVPAGSYYLAASSTTDQFIVNIDTQEIPVPEKPYNPSPEHTATGISNPTLDWEFGRYTVEYQVLLGGQYPPTDVLVDWTNDFDMEIVAENLYHNTNYFWQVNTRNTSGVTYGDIWAFVTTFNIPEDLTVADPTIFEGEDAVLTWTNVQDRSHRGYNVYVDGVKVNESTIFGNTYNVEGLTYNMDGYEIAVSAVYDEGESFLSDPVMVYVSGLGTIEGYTYEQDSITIIPDVTITLNGKDEFGDTQSYTLTSDENGFYTGDVLAGRYVGVATKDGYQRAIVTDIDVYYNYGNNVTHTDFVMPDT